MPRQQDSSTRLRAAACAIAFGAATAMPVVAQRIEIDGVASRGDRTETRRAFGYSARLAIPILPFVSGAVGYSKLGFAGDVDGSVCAQTDSACAGETLHNDLVLGTVDYELMLPVRLLGLEVSAAAGIDVTTVESDQLRTLSTGGVVHASAPEHGLAGSLFSFNGRHYRLGAGISPLFGLPVTFRAAWQRRVMDLDACSSDAYSPFCGEMRADQILIGLSIGAR